MTGRPFLRVACGVLRRADGRLLLAQRPPGKVAAGRWEFPGGKLEPGESALQALHRELHEELGVRVESARRLRRFRHAYSDRDVELDTWLVERFAGEPEGREAQALRWLLPSQVADLDCLPTVAPILAGYALPAQYLFTASDQPAQRLLQAVAQLPSGLLLRLRQPQLSDADYATLAASMLPMARNRGVRLVLDRQPAMVSQLGADGWHASEAVMSALQRRPLPAEVLTLASVHSLSSAQMAEQKGFDAVVLGQVAATPSHPGEATLGWAGFADIAQRLQCPVFAIGGMRAELLGDAREAFAHGVAGIRGFWPAAGGKAER